MSAPLTLTPSRPGTYRMLDAYRGMASLGVVAFHWAEMSARRQPELAGNALYAACGYGFLGVQIFFVISGYCIAAAAVGLLRRGDSLGSYGVARLRRIYPTYWAALILVTIFYEISYHLAKRGVIAENILTETSVFDRGFWYHFGNITLTTIPLHETLRLAVAWTLCYEIAFYALVGMALALCARNAGRLLTLLHILTLTALAALLLRPTHGVFPLNLWPHFGLGIFLYDLLAYKGDTRRTRAVGIGFAVSLAMYAAFAALYNVPIGAMGQTSRLTFAVAGAFALFLLATYRFDAIWSKMPPLRWLSFVGVFSYSLYLIHMMPLRIWNQFWQKLHAPGYLHPLAFVGAFVVAVGCAYGFFYLFERPLLIRKGKATT